MRGIACAIGAGARIVIMDEPTASLTRREQDRLFAVVREMRAGGTGVIYISHRLEEIFSLADRVTVLRDGGSVGTQDVRDVTDAGLLRDPLGERGACCGHGRGVDRGAGGAVGGGGVREVRRGQRRVGDGNDTHQPAFA